MKKTKLTTLIKNLLLGIFTVTIVFSFYSCNRKVSFITSTVVPAARGYVKVKRDHNKNYVILIQLLDLAEVERLQPPKQIYVVWMVTDRGVTQNIGRINSSTGHLSKTLKASFESVSSFKPAKIFITAENDAGTQIPGDQVVLSTDKFGK